MNVTTVVLFEYESSCAMKEQYESIVEGFTPTDWSDLRFWRAL